MANKKLKEDSAGEKRLYQCMRKSPKTANGEDVESRIRGHVARSLFTRCFAVMVLVKSQSPSGPSGQSYRVRPGSY